LKTKYQVLKTDRYITIILKEKEKKRASGACKTTGTLLNDQTYESWAEKRCKLKT
jgi:hypothetical protein